MDYAGISPLYWTADILAELGNDIIHELALRCVGTRTAYHFTLGRYLLAGERTGLFAEYGCSCVSHYGAVILGIPGREASEALRVASALEGLPFLTRAAEAGEIGWCKLREVVRKATRATEQYWLFMCKNRTYAEIMKLLRFSDFGGLPDPERVSGKGDAGIKAELRYSLSFESMAVVERGMQFLAEEEGRTLSMEEASVYLFSQYLKGRDGGCSLDQVMAEANKDAQAGCYRMERLVMEARNVARQFGLLDEDQDGSSEDDSADSRGEPEAAADSGTTCAPEFLPGAEYPRDNASTPEVKGDAGKDADEFNTLIGHQAVLRHTCVVGREQVNESPLINDNEALPRHSTAASREQVDEATRFNDNEALPRQATVESQADCAANPCCLDGALYKRVDEKSTHLSVLSTPEPDESDCERDGERSGSRHACASDEPTSVQPQSIWRPYAAAEISVCPTDEKLLLASPNQASWRNKRLKYNHGARGTTKAQRRDLLRRDGYCCPTPGCPNQLWLQVHHLKPHAHGGATVEWNLLPLCLRCHTNVHEGRLIIKGCPEEGTLEFYDAHGRRLGHGAPLERAAWLDSYVERVSEETRAFLYLQGLGVSMPGHAAANFEPDSSPLIASLQDNLFVAKTSNN